MDEMDQMRRYRYTADRNVVNPASGKRANRPYSPASYAAQYGIAIVEAEEILDSFGGPGNTTHAEVERVIFEMIREREHRVVADEVQAQFIEEEAERSEEQA